MIPLQKGLALDIDETLSITGKAIILGLQKNFGNPENMSPEELMKKYKHTSKIPYWQTEEVYIWKTEFLQCDDLYRDVPLIENANHIVQKIEQILPISCYLTARPANVVQCTEEWLKRHGFPDRPVIAKPMDVPYEDGNKWKAGELIKYQSEIMGIVDDNPGLISYLPEDYQGTIFLYSHLDYSNDTPLNIIPCKDWDAVYNKIQKQARLFGRA